MASITSLMNSNYNTSSIYGNRNVLSGLASGMDTETMIENAVSGYKTKIENLLKQRTKIEWQQEAYRSIIDKAVGLNSKYTSYTSKTNLLSPSFFSNAVLTTTSGTYADKVTASGKTNSDIQINSVKQLATAASYTVAGLGGSGAVGLTGDYINPVKTVETSNVQGMIAINYGGANGKTFDVELDSTAYGSLDEMAKDINEKLKDMAGVEDGSKASDYVEAKVSGGKIVFSEKSSVTGSTKGSKVTATLNGNIAKTMSSKANGSAAELSLNAGKTLSTSNVMRQSLKDKTLNLTLDGVTKSIDLTGLSKTNNAEEFKKELSDQVSKAFGDKVSVSFKDSYDGGFSISFDAKQAGSTVSVSGTAASTLGFSSGDGNYINTGKKLGELLDSNGLKNVFSESNRLKGEGDAVMKTRSDGTTYYVDSKGNYVDKNGYRVDSDGNAMYDFQVNDAHINVTKETTLESLMNSINSNPDAGVKVSYSKLTNEFKFTASETGSNSKIEFGGMAQALFGASGSSGDRFTKTYGLDLADGESKEVSFDLPECGVDLEIKDTDSMQDVVDRLNKTLPKFGYSATYNETSGQIIVTDKTGKMMDLKMSADSETLEAKSASNYTTGQDAVMDVTINGKQFENLSRSTNSFDLDGLTVNVKGTFGPKDGEDYEPVTFTTATDSDKIVDAIKAFVDDYNEMITELKGAYSTLPAQQTDGSRYDPLTASQEEGLTESEIKSYEEKAKQGILFGDSTLSSMYSKLLGAIAPGGTDGQTLREIGIGTSYENGLTTISLDEDKLRAALDSNPDKVKDAFTKTKEGGAASDGLMQTLQNTLNTYTKTTGEPKGVLITKAGSIKAPTTINSNSLQTQMNNIDKQVESWQNKMSAQIDRYTTQFSRLEQLIAEMNSQASAFAGLMGGDTGY